MKRALVLLLLAFPVASRSQTAVNAWMNLGAVAPNASVVASPSPPGTTLSTTVANAGMVGSGINWTTVVGTAANMTVGPHQAACNLGTPITVAGTTYTQAATSQSYQYNDSVGFTDIRGTLGSVSGPRMSVGLCFISGITPVGTGTHNDRVYMDNGNGHIVVIQQCPGTVGSGCGGYILHLEVTAPGGSGVGFSGSITIQQNVAYWVTAQIDWSLGTAKMNVYLANYPYTQIGTTVTANTVVENSNPAHIRVGNDEAWTSASTSFFENLIVDTSASPTFPLGSGSLATAWKGILSPSRAVDWTQAGVVGGIPPRTTICNTLSPGVTTAQINTALSGCPAGQAVLLNAGTYSGLGTLFIPNNVTLRGSGANQTFLVFSGASGCHGASAVVCMNSADNNNKTTPSNLVNWTAGYVPGTSVITLASVPNLNVGDFLILDQLDDTELSGCDVGGFLVTQSTGTCTATSPGIGGPFATQGNLGGSERSAGGVRSQEEFPIVASCNGNSTPGFACTGTNVSVGISPPLMNPNWRATQTPQAWWPTSPGTGMGVEDVSIDATGAAGAQGVEAFNVQNSWIVRSRVVDPTRAHVQLQYSSHFTVKDNYFFITQGAGQTSNYGFECFGAGNFLVENNIFHAVTGPIQDNSACTGGVEAYNYTVNNYYTVSPLFSQGSAKDHTAGNSFVLREGNRFNANFEADVIHGTHNMTTLFRNQETGTNVNCYSSGGTYATSVYAPCNNNQLGIFLRAFSRFYNIVANVWGKSGLQGGYQSGTQPLVYALNNGDTGSGVTVPGDPNVTSTLLRYGNYDVSTAANRFCGNSSNTGFATTCGSVSEVPLSLSPNVQAQFSNPEPSVGDTVAGQAAFPASLYLAGQPAFWPATGKPFPGIGPDVTGGNIAGLNGHAYTNPAEDCYLNTMGGLADGTGNVLNFNANACYYGSSSAPAVNLTPSSLAFANQAVTTTSVAQTITLTNTGTAVLNITSIVITGANAADFVIQVAGTTCPTGAGTLGSGLSCTVNITFSPTLGAAESASAVFTTNASTSPNVGLLSGTGVIVGVINGNGSIKGTGVVHN